MEQGISYPDFEQEKLRQIKSLMAEWKSSLSEEEQKLFVPDGFYPHYFSKNPRILFVAKESTGMLGLVYTDTLFDCYRNEKRIGEKNINQYRFHARMMYMAYGILNKESTFEEFQATPFASKIGDTFGTEDGVSFAFMNISKSSNENGTYANEKLIETSYAHGKKFIKREIELLEPDVIISANVTDKITDIFGEPNVLERIGGNSEVCDVCAQTIKVNSKDTLLLDCWHFSGIKGKKDFEHFYHLVCEFTKTISTNKNRYGRKIRHPKTTDANSVDG